MEVMVKITEEVLIALGAVKEPACYALNAQIYKFEFRDTCSNGYWIMNAVDGSSKAVTNLQDCLVVAYNQGKLDGEYKVQSDIRKALGLQ